MENSGLRFFQIFNFGGTIAVNSLTFGELIAVNIATLFVMILLLGSLATLIPIILFFIFCIFLLLGNWEEMQLDRIRLNIISMVGYVYFMIDYHYGFIGWSFFNTFFGSNFVDKLCYINTALFIFNGILLFVGNGILNQINLGLTRLVVFILISIMGYKILVPFGSIVAPMITTQYIPKPGDEIIKTNEDVKEKPYEGQSLEEDMEEFERGRGNYNYEATPHSNEICESEENCGC
jgi:hypothetical protein